jgi:hypothetical protein
MRYPGPIRSLGDTVADAFALVRRRRQVRSPRVRVRTGHGEAQLLPADAPACERVLSLAGELVAAYGREPGRGDRGRL